MSKFKIAVKLVKVIPGYFEIEADSLEDAILLVEETASINDMICNENEIYEDIIVNRKGSIQYG